MAILTHQSSLQNLTQYTPMRCDTHFITNMSKAAKSFFDHKDISWVSLGSVLEDVRNGVNLGTSLYAMDETTNLYISVSQIKEHGLIEKNQSYLSDDVRSVTGFFELVPGMLLITRSGTIGVALSTDNPSFEFDEYSYIPSGFVITAKIKNGISANMIASYLNLFPVQSYLVAMAAGACQKNLAQPAINALPIPESILDNSTHIQSLFDKYRAEADKIIQDIKTNEIKLTKLKQESANTIIEILSSSS